MENNERVCELLYNNIHSFEELKELGYEWTDEDTVDCYLNSGRRFLREEEQDRDYYEDIVKPLKNICQGNGFELTKFGTIKSPFDKGLLKHEEYDLHAVKVGDWNDKSKPVVVLTADVHPNEPSGRLALMKFLGEDAAKYAEDNNVNVLVVPNLNPIGFEVNTRLNPQYLDVNRGARTEKEAKEKSIERAEESVAFMKMIDEEIVQEGRPLAYAGDFHEMQKADKYIFAAQALKEGKNTPEAAEYSNGFFVMVVKALGEVGNIFAQKIIDAATAEGTGMTAATDEEIYEEKNYGGKLPTTFTGYGMVVSYMQDVMDDQLQAKLNKTIQRMVKDLRDQPNDNLNIQFTVNTDKTKKLSEMTEDEWQEWKGNLQEAFKEDSIEGYLQELQILRDSRGVASITEPPADDFEPKVLVASQLAAVNAIMDHAVELAQKLRLAFTPNTLGSKKDPTPS